MLRYGVTYATTLLAFAAMDSVWLTLFAGPLFRKTLGPVLLENFRAAPAVVFYLLMIAGIMVFVVPRAPGAQTWPQTALFGALFGFFTYATFDLTSYTIIRPWTFYLAITDLAWGTLLTAAASTLGVAAAAWVLRLL